MNFKWRNEDLSKLFFHCVQMCNKIISNLIYWTIIIKDLIINIIIIKVSFIFDYLSIDLLIIYMYM